MGKNAFDKQLFNNGSFIFRTKLIGKELTTHTWRHVNLILHAVFNLIF